MALPQPPIQYNPSDPLEQTGKVITLGNLLQARQLQGQEIQAGQLENQQRQMDLDSQKALQKAYMDANGDPDKTTQLAAKYGAKPQALLQWQNTVLDQKAKTLDLVQKQGAEAKRQADLMQGAHDAITAAQDKPTEYLKQLSGLQQQGVDTSKMPQQYPGDQPFQLLGAVVKGHSQMVEDALKASEQAKNTAQDQEATATTNKINLETKWGTPQMQESRYRFVLNKLAAKQDVSPDDMAAAVAYEASNRKTTTQSDSLGVTSTNTSAPTGLAAFKKGGGGQGAGGTGAGAAPNAKDSIVDLFGQYKADPALMSRMLLKHPEIAGMIQQKYPDFDQTTYVAKNKLIQGYTSGGQSKEINAINTVASHLSIMNDAVDALNNGDVKVLNGIANKLGAAVGQTSQATFKTIVHRIGPEITTAYVQGGGGEAERFANEQDFSENNAPQVLKQNAAVTVKLLRGKIGALENQYKNTVGRDDFQQKFITPDAQAAFQKLAPTTAPASQGGAFDFNKFSQHK